MSRQQTAKIKQIENATILYDASIIVDPEPALFNMDYHINNKSHQSLSVRKTNEGLGRAQVVYFDYAGIPCVLKHYYRGGLVAKLLNDQYFGINPEASRAFREWRLLCTMRDLSLPVPRPVAAQAIKQTFFIKADLITEFIPESRTLAGVLEEASVTAELWENIGNTVSRFHQHNIYHADLNARNILLDNNNDIFLIDFDNSRIRVSSDSQAKSWKAANLARLHRSLVKIASNCKSFYFDEKDWQSLLSGYNK